MKLLSERLRWAMSEEGKRLGREVRPADLGRAAKSSSASVNFWLNDVNGIGAAKARLIAEYLHVDPIWLETGEGKPQKDAQHAEAGTESNVRAYDPEDGIPDDVILVPESRIEFSAGDGRIHYELVEEEEAATYRRSWFQKHGINPKRARRFRVTGNSMEPMLFARDTILVNLDETEVIDGRLYALRYADQLRVKFLSKRLDGTLVLRSVNPAYKDEEVPAEMANEHITVIGRVRDRSGTGGM